MPSEMYVKLLSFHYQVSSPVFCDIFASQRGPHAVLLLENVDSTVLLYYVFLHKKLTISCATKGLVITMLPGCCGTIPNLTP